MRPTVNVCVQRRARVHSVVRFWGTYLGRKSGVLTCIRTSLGYKASILTPIFACTTVCYDARR